MSLPVPPAIQASAGESVGARCGPSSGDAAAEVLTTPSPDQPTSSPARALLAGWGFSAAAELRDRSPVCSRSCAWRLCHAAGLGVIAPGLGFCTHDPPAGPDAAAAAGASRDAHGRDHWRRLRMFTPPPRGRARGSWDNHRAPIPRLVVQRAPAGRRRTRLCRLFRCPTRSLVAAILDIVSGCLVEPPVCPTLTVPIH